MKCETVIPVIIIADFSSRFNVSFLQSGGKLARLVNDSPVHLQLNIHHPGAAAARAFLAIYFQNAMYVFFSLMGLYVEVERHTVDGRMDVLVQTADYIYIFELKIDKDADTALKQIKDKRYANPFASDRRKLFKIGINFSTEKRIIDDWKIEE